MLAAEHYYANLDRQLRTVALKPEKLQRDLRHPRIGIRYQLVPLGRALGAQTYWNEPFDRLADELLRTPTEEIENPGEDGTWVPRMIA